MQETISTLNFANRAKNIRNEAKVNEDLDQKSLLRKYERELKKLRAELEERNKNVVDKRRLLELDEQRRRAEADKMTAIRALEATSLEFMHEKEEKKKLEQRIAMLMGQMLRGDKTGPDGGPGREGEGVSLNPEIHIMMKEQQEKLSKEYQFKLADLERERETIEEEKAQVDRYKQLLLKQRDIMIALTQRLVERDEQIMALQDELDAYDSHHKELEEKLDEKTAMLIKLQRISMEVNATSPYKNEELNKALGESWSRQDGGRSSGATEVVNDEDSLSSPLVRSTIENQRNRIAELEQMLKSSAQAEGRGGAHSRSGDDSAAIRALKEEVSPLFDN
jgi:kinesin family protein 3/17